MGNADAADVGYKNDSDPVHMLLINIFIIANLCIMCSLGVWEDPISFF